MTENERAYLRRCLDLAREALEAGDQPFGSVLVGADGRILAEDRNRTSSGDSTRHPEFELARWAANNLSPEERAAATVYTSGEHCPMCAAAHAWVGLGPIPKFEAKIRSLLRCFKVTDRLARRLAITLSPGVKTPSA